MGKKFASFDLRDGVLRVVLSYLPQVPDSGIDIKIEKTGRDEYTITTQVKKRTESAKTGHRNSQSTTSAARDGGSPRN